MAPAAAPGLFRGILDDASVFPPGNLPLDQALRAHLEHLGGPHRSLVGPWVVSAEHLAQLPALVADLAPSSLDLAVTVPLVEVPDAVMAVARIAAVRLVALEIVLAEADPIGDVVPTIKAALGETRSPLVYVEVPRDGRRSGLIRELASSPYRAKLRTGGMTSDMFPGIDELAVALTALVRSGVPFKATAGLHHAIRHTDPVTGLVHHGFLNVLAAVAAALAGASPNSVAAILEERDGGTVAERVRRLDVAARHAFVSFGTCSISEPTADLVEHGLLPAGQLRNTELKA